MCFAAPFIAGRAHFPHAFHISHSDVQVIGHIQPVVEYGFHVSIPALVKNHICPLPSQLCPDCEMLPPRCKNLISGMTVLIYNRASDRPGFRRLRQTGRS
jgi:hypothetical protein